MAVLCVVLVSTRSDANENAAVDAVGSRVVEGGANSADEQGSLSMGFQLPRLFSFRTSDESATGLAQADYRGEVDQPRSVAQVAGARVALTGLTPTQAPGEFQGIFARNTGGFGVGTDFYSPPEFKGGLIVYGEDVAMKIGGYVKTDFIYDFDPISSTDTFNTTDIEVGSPDRTNARFHSRQTRLSFDTRWVSGDYPVRIFVEGDFFGSGSSYRLRHAYGEVGSILVGQTWTTFTDVAAAPATLDFEGSVSNVNRRQAMIRWTQPVPYENLTLAIAAEDTRFNVIPPGGVPGEARSPSPDLVSRLRLSKDWGQFQVAGLYRLGGFQPTGDRVVTRSAWGLNFTSTVLLTERSKVYQQFVFGEGIGSYRGLPDAAPSSATSDELLGLTGWMVGYTQQWTDCLNSNFTYGENSLDNTLLQDPGDVHRTTYLAVNLIWNPVDRVRVGIEYLYGLRENVDRDSADAHRIQSAFIFDLP